MFWGEQEMFGEDRLMSLLEDALKFSRVEQLEIMAYGQHSFLTRYSENYIHQNVGERNYQVVVRAVNDKRIGVAFGNQVDREHLREVIEKAQELSCRAPRREDFKSLPGKSVIPLGPKTFWIQTEECPADLRAAYVQRVINMSREKGLRAAGAMSTGTLELGVVNSLGVRAYMQETRASLSALVMSEDSSGFCQSQSMDVADIEPTQVAATAIEKCLRSRNPASIEPGTYDVILEPLAVADMVMYLSFLGFSAYSFQEGQSFLCDSLGKRIAAENVSIWDDGLDARGFPLLFDFEGVPKEKVVFIDSGVARGVAYDSYTAAKEGKKSTGHALPQGSFIGSLPMNLFVAPGDSTLDEMIGSTERGILITRFHYVNPVHPLKTIITGMTRDGTFLIEHGKVTKGLKNMRFTQSILEALSNVELVGEEQTLNGGDMSIVCPAMKIKNFTFTGVTEF